MPRSMSSLCAACCDWFLSYNSVRIVSMNNPKLGGVNRFIQALVVAYSVFSLLDGRQYMRKETVLGAQDVYGEVEPRKCVAAARVSRALFVDTAVSSAASHLSA